MQKKRWAAKASPIDPLGDLQHSRDIRGFRGRNYQGWGGKARRVNEWEGEGERE